MAPQEVQWESQLLWSLGIPKHFCLSQQSEKDIWGGTPQNWNYLLEGMPLIVQASFATCSRNTSVSVYLLVLLWEAAFASEFFLKTLSTHFPFHGGWFTSTPAHPLLSAQQFLTKNGLTPVIHPPYSPDLAPVTSFVSSDEKQSSKGNALPLWRRWNKNSRSTKRPQNWQVPNLFWAVEKISW